MGTKFSDWAARQDINETPVEAELRRRFAAGFALGLQIHDARVAQGISQRVLAEASGIPQPEISRIESGAGNPTESTLQRLAAALGQRLILAP
ncbi:MAG TPA: helix-turn-helix transcriptional regulator [Streptosporangiaceae bacterium]|nr:helix-turn-helix transcriptional regulator [Streptosporangiaceae bacterium]